MKENTNILIVDDDPIFCQTLSDILQVEGYKITTCTKTEEIINLVKKKDFDGILLDLKLTGTDGISIMQKIKELKPVIWVIIITAYSSLQSAIIALNQGADAYLQKPLNINEAKTVIAKTIEKQRLAAERDRYQKELAQAKDYLESIIEYAGDGIMVVKGKDNRIISWNKAAQEITGFPASQVKGKNWLQLFPKKRHSEIKQLAKRILQGEVIKSFDIEMMTSTDQNLSVNFTASPLKGAEGSINAITIIFKDISQRKQWEKILIHSAKMDTIAHMSARIAHEIRNPLSSICSAASILLRDLKLSKEDKTLMHIIEKETMRIEKIISSFLERCRPSREQEEKVDLQVIFTEIATLLDKDKAISPNIKIEKNLQPPAEVIADSNMMHQLFWNLLLNSAESMPQGGVIKIEGKSYSEMNRDFYIISIKDDGMGIKKKDLDHLFDPFFSTKNKRSGLGLAVAKYIVDKYKGKMKIESQWEKGTSVTLYLPLNPSTV